MDSLHTTRKISLDLMFPQSDNPPSLPSEVAEIAGVTLSVGLNLRLPGYSKLVAPLWEAIAVPEVTIDEDREALPAEYDVRASADPFIMLPKAQSAPMQFAPHEPFYAGILPTDGGHDA